MRHYADLSRKTIFQERSLPEAKITPYIPAAMALNKAKSNNAEEALYVNRRNQVLEGTTSNLFLFIDDILITPKDHVLKGITRYTILSLSSKYYKIEEQPVTLSELLSADEVFITGTNKWIVPVVKIDKRTIGSGAPGPNTKNLMNKLIDHTLIT